VVNSYGKMHNENSRLYKEIRSAYERRMARRRFRPSQAEEMFRDSFISKLKSAFLLS
jgi:hypothetical protein